MTLSREQNRLRMRAVRAVAHHPDGVHQVHEVHGLAEAVEAELATLGEPALASRPAAVASARRLAVQLDADPSSPRVALWIRELLTVLDGLRVASPRVSVGAQIRALR